MLETNKVLKEKKKICSDLLEVSKDIDTLKNFGSPKDNQKDKYDELNYKMNPLLTEDDIKESGKHLINFNKGASFAANTFLKENQKDFKIDQEKEANMKHRLNLCENQISEMMSQIDSLRSENTRLKIDLLEINEKNNSLFQQNQTLIKNLEKLEREKTANENVYSYGYGDYSNEKCIKYMKVKDDLIKPLYNQNEKKAEEKDGKKLFYNYGIGSNEIINEISEGPQSELSFNKDGVMNKKDVILLDKLKSLFNTNENDLIYSSICHLIEESSSLFLMKDFTYKVSDLFIKLTDSKAFDKSHKPDIKILWRWIKSTVTAFRSTASELESYKKIKNSVPHSKAYSSLIFQEKNKTEVANNQNRYRNLSSGSYNDKQKK